MQANNIFMQTDKTTVQTNSILMQSVNITVQTSKVSVQTNNCCNSTDKGQRSNTLTSQRTKSGTWSGTQSHNTKANLPKSLACTTLSTHPTS